MAFFTRWHLFPLLLIALLIPAGANADKAPTTAPATQPADAGSFLRFVDDDAGGGKLETAIANYRNAAGVTVHLVAAVHVADGKYYRALNKTFTKYDAVLYELVKPKHSGLPAPGAPSHSGIGIFQHMMKDALDLDFQLDDIDYTQPNFVHADLDVETFTQMQNARGESIFGLMLHSMLHEMEREAEGEGPKHPMDLFDLLAALHAPDRTRALKLLLGRQFGDIEEQMADLDGPDGSVLITERNKKCIDTLKQEISAGKKNIGVFYGAGHMRDLSHRLETMGFHATKTTWRVAWDLTAAPTTRPTTGPATLPIRP